MSDKRAEGEVSPTSGLEEAKWIFREEATRQEEAVTHTKEEGTEKIPWVVMEGGCSREVVRSRIIGGLSGDGQQKGAHDRPVARS